MTNFSEMLSKAKVMQEKMKEAQDQIKKIEAEGKAGGNLVTLLNLGTKLQTCLSAFKKTLPLSLEGSVIKIIL